MGATDILPYPRRRSSIQLEPLGTANATSPTTKTNRILIPSNSIELEMELPGSVGSAERLLRPVRVPRRRTSSPHEARCRSCDGLRMRSNSLLPPERPARPGESRRRTSNSQYDDDMETTAQFIERIRKELITQL